MTVALRAEISAEEYAELRVAAIKAGVSAQEYVGTLLRASLGEPGAAGSAAVSELRPERTSAPSVSREERATPSASPEDTFKAEPFEDAP